MQGSPTRILGLPAATAGWCALLFAVAAIGYHALWRAAPVLEGDSSQYLEVARDLADGHLDRIYVRTPGYPLLLVLTGSTETPARLLFSVSLGLHLACVWLLIVALSAAAVPSKWLTACAAFLLLPPFVEPAAQVMTENLSEFLLAGGVSLLVAWYAWRRNAERPVMRAVALTLASAAFACATLTRPAYQALPIALGICIVFFTRIPGPLPRRRPWGACAVLLAGSALIVGGFAATNYARFGYFGVVPSLGFHLSTKTMGFVERLPEEYAPVRELLIRERDAELVKPGGTHNSTQTVWQAREKLHQQTGLDTVALSGYLLRMNLTLIRTAPLEYLQEVARAMTMYWFPAAGPLASMHSGLLRWLWILLHFALVAILFVQAAAIVGALVLPVPRRMTVTAVQAFAYGLAALVIVYTFLLSSFLDIGEVRHRRPTDVLIVFACVIGLRVWQESLRGIIERDTLNHG